MTDGFAAGHRIVHIRKRLPLEIKRNSEFDASAEASGRHDFGHSEFSKT
jgi:hypothetical protein